MMRVLLLLLATVLLSSGSDTSDSLTPYPLTDAEKASARQLAETVLTDKFLPIATSSPESFDLRGIELKDPRLGEPFLDVTLRGGRSLRAYVDSDEDDPRVFAAIVNYCFPVYVSGVTDPIISIAICRNRDESGKKFQPDQGDMMLWGYYMQTPGGRSGNAVRLRDQYGGQISFVTFMDTGISTVMVEDSAGVRSGFKEDSLVPMAELAKKIKRKLPLWRDD